MLRFGATLALVTGVGIVGADAAPTLEAEIARLIEADRSYRLAVLRLSEGSAQVGVEVAASIPLDDLPPDFENRWEMVVGLLAAQRPELTRIDLAVAHPGKRLAPPPVRARAGSVRRPRALLRDPKRFPFGQALADKVIAISPGHGYIYYDTLGRYSTQRGNVKWTGCGDCRGLVEDFGTHELAIRHLIPLLEGAGAQVVLVRERSYDPQSVVLDAGDQGYFENGSYQDGSTEGGHGGGYRASFSVDASAEWRIQAAWAGPQLLSTWFVAGDNRYENATLEVEGPGGVRRYRLDQTRLGQRWTAVDLFDLDLGQSLLVKLLAPMGAGGDRALIADAFRLGGGTHSSGHPWWSMGAQPYSVFQSAPADVTGRGDVTARPRYAEWFGADLYLALHSNASGQENSTAAGTVTYRYNCGTYPDHSNDPPAADCDDPSGSDRAQLLVHQAMVAQIRGDWDSNWIDRGTKVANFGEVRELDGIPGVLVESAFHDNVRLPEGSRLRMTDNQALHDPRWRKAAAYGLYRGISAFFDQPDRLVLQPPQELWARRVSASEVELGFESVAGAQAYRVYLAKNGRDFDEGQVFADSPARITGLAEGDRLALQVSALNEAGEGPRSGVVVARASSRPAQLLLVDGFQREDAWVQDVDNLHNTLLVHAEALTEVDFAFDSATESALDAFDLSAYDGVVLALGRESTEHQILTAALRGRLIGHPAVFASGSELGWALDARGDAESRAFLAQFGATYAADDAATLSVAGADGWFSGDFALAGPGQNALETRSSDVFAATSSAAVELRYENGSAAAVRSQGRLVLGFALDSLVEPAARAQILGTWATRTVVLAPPVELPDGGVAPPDAGFVDLGSAPDAETPQDAGVMPDADRARLTAITRPPIRGGCSGSAGGVELDLLIFWVLVPQLFRRKKID